MAGAGRELIWRLYEQCKADGLEVSISRLCAWFGVARRSVYYRPHRKQPVVKECYSEPIKQLIEEQPSFGYRGRFRKRNLKHAKECSIQQRRGFACGVCRWKRRFGCSRNSAVSAARFESGFRERDGQGQHWRGPHSHGGFLKMIVCESGGHANGLTYFIFRFLRRPQQLVVAAG